MKLKCACIHDDDCRLLAECTDGFECMYMLRPICEIAHFTK